MADKTNIEWTKTIHPDGTVTNGATWNPVTGCTKVSAGCKHCYAEREWPRMTKLVPAYTGRAFTDVHCHPERLEQPLRWSRPRKVFVNSMSDLFHPDVTDEFIDEVFAVMTFAWRHTFQILTKRPERMRDYMRRDPVTDALRRLALKVRGLPMQHGEKVTPWPRPNVWLGVSVENQETADARIPLLLQTPAAVRFISAEPLLGPISFRWASWVDRERMHREHGKESHLDGLRGIDWVIAGGESGPKARPSHPEWFRSLRDQCKAAGVAFFMKQITNDRGRKIPREDWPQDLNIEEYPNALR